MRIYALSTKKKKKTVILNIVPFLVSLGIVGLDQVLKRIFIIKLPSTKINFDGFFAHEVPW